MRHFTIEELERSATADRLGIENRAGETERMRMEALIDDVLDPLREAWGAPIRVNSGYRCPALNKAVGGAERSQHMRGEAADITVGSAVDNRRLLKLAVKLGLDFDQLIWEKGGQWLHISHKQSGNRRRVLSL